MHEVFSIAKYLYFNVLGALQHTFDVYLSTTKCGKRLSLSNRQCAA